MHNIATGYCHQDFHVNYLVWVNRENIIINNAEICDFADLDRTLDVVFMIEPGTIDSKGL